MFACQAYTAVCVFVYLPDCHGSALKILAGHDSCTIYYEQCMYFPAKRSWS